MSGRSTGSLFSTSMTRSPGWGVFVEQCLDQRDLPEPRAPVSNTLLAGRRLTNWRVFASMRSFCASMSCEIGQANGAQGAGSPGDSHNGRAFASETRQPSSSPVRVILGQQRFDPFEQPARRGQEIWRAARREFIGKVSLRRFENPAFGQTMHKCQTKLSLIVVSICRCVTRRMCDGENQLRAIDLCQVPPCVGCRRVPDQPPAKANAGAHWKDLQVGPKMTSRRHGQLFPIVRRSPVGRSGALACGLRGSQKAWRQTMRQRCVVF